MGQLQEAAEGYVPRDSFFGTPYVDVDEQRETPVPHRYVHGGFADTATRFSFYFPDTYDGRFFHFLDGGYGGNENTSVARGGGFGSLSFAASRGGYFVESNQGHIGAETCPKAGEDATVYAYRANAECALLSRHLADAIYGRAPEHGYVFGGSGGGHRTLCAMEYVEGDRRVGRRRRQRHRLTGHLPRLLGDEQRAAPPRRPVRGGRRRRRTRRLR